MPNTKKDARECARLWGRGEIISEIHGDDPGMTRLRTCRLCHAQDAGPMHRYAIRHYAHHDCYLRLRFLDLYARRWWLSPLSRWPLKAISRGRTER